MWQEYGRWTPGVLPAGQCVRQHPAEVLVDALMDAVLEPNIE